MNGNFEASDGAKADLHTQRVRSLSQCLRAFPIPVHFAKPSLPDFNLPPPTKLCLYLQLHDLIRASFRSPPASIQPTANPPPMPPGGETFRRRLIAEGNVPLYNEGKTPPIPRQGILGTFNANPKPLLFFL